MNKVFSFDEKTYILGYWMAQKGEWIWSAIVYKNEKYNEWLLVQTFVDKKNDNDYECSCLAKDLTETEEEVLKSMDRIFNKAKEKYDDFNDSFLVRGGSDKFLEMAKRKHYLKVHPIH